MLVPLVADRFSPACFDLHELRNESCGVLRNFEAIPRGRVEDNPSMERLRNLQENELADCRVCEFNEVYEHN